MAKTFRKCFSYVCCLSLLLITQLSGAQDNTDRIPLADLLFELESDFDVKFSYTDDALRDVLVTIPTATDLPTILGQIEVETDLQIEKLDNRYYTLTQKPYIDICGQVLDNFEQNTVAGATVRVLGTDIAMVTDSTGNFSVQDVPRQAYLQIKHLGYKTLFIAAERLTPRKNCTKLLLAQYVQRLEEVVVYEYLTQGLVKQRDGGIDVNSKRFGILPGLIEPDVLQTIQALPGIESVDETVSNINIRGGTNDQNLVLWDGIKMYQSGHFFGLISAFNPYITESVNLTKNGTSARYGEAVSGVIAIGTKESIAEGIYGGAGVNLISADAYLQVPITDNLAVQISARRSLTDALNTPTYQRFFTRVFEEGEVDPSGNFYFYDFTGKVLYDLNDKHELRFNFINVNNLLDYSERDMETGERSRSDLDQRSLSFGLGLRSQWSKKFSSFLNVYSSGYELEARNTSANAEQTLFQNNDVNEAAFQLHSDYSLNQNFTWSNGYHFSETAIGNATDVTQPPFESNVKNIVRGQALYSELGYISEDEKLFARGGIRLNYYLNPDTFEQFVPEPRLSMDYFLTQQLSFQLLGEYKSQAINQIIDLEQDFLGIEKRRWIVSDGEALPLTRSKQAAIGVNYNQKNLHIGLEGFVKEVNGISTSTQGFQNRNQFNGETGKYNIKGVEFLINKKSDAFSVWASYGYNLNTYRFLDVDPQEFPNNLDIRHRATLAGTYTLKNLKLGLGLNYRTGKPYTEPRAEDPLDDTFFPSRINYREPNSSRLPEYLRADASAIYDFDIGSKINATAGISVLNFTNRKNALDSYFQVHDDNEIEGIENLSLGITPNLSFRVQF